MLCTFLFKCWQVINNYIPTFYLYFLVYRYVYVLIISRNDCVQCRAFLDPEDIFKCEVEETHDKLLSALAGLETFKETYEDHRRRLPEYRSKSSVGSDAPPEDWEFPPQIIFHRYDRFLARLANIRVRINPRCFHLETIYIGFLASTS